MYIFFIFIFLTSQFLGVFRPLKKKVSPRILATASKLVLQRSMEGLQEENTQGDLG